MRAFSNRDGCVRTSVPLNVQIYGANLELAVPFSLLLRKFIKEFFCSINAVPRRTSVRKCSGSPPGTLRIA